MKKLSESVWGDIRKKSLGQEDRIEESVDNIPDINGLFNYIKERYKKEHLMSHNGPFEFKVSLGAEYTHGSDISVTIFWLQNKKIMKIKAPNDLLGDLSGKYPISGNALKEKDEELKNSTIIAVIDTILNLIPNYIYMERYIEPV